MPRGRPKKMTEETTEEMIETAQEIVKKPEGRVFTYIGGGENSPGVIKFMGKIDMVRGTPITVTDNNVAAKMEVCPTIIEGEITLNEIQDLDVEAKEKADAQRREDLETNKRAQKALGR